MPLGYPDKPKGATAEAVGNEKPGSVPESRVFARGPFDAADELDVALYKHFSQISALISPPPVVSPGSSSLSRVQAQLQERASASAQQHSSIVLGILYGLLADFSSRSRLFGLLRAVTRDTHTSLLSSLHKLCQDKWPKLKQEARHALLWLIEQLLFDLEVSDAEVPLLCIIRQMASGDLSDNNVWLASQVLTVLSSHKSAVYGKPPLLTGSLFSFLRLLADHAPSQRPAVRTLANQEVEFCVAALRDRFQDCLIIGRDLLRLLQDVAGIPEIQGVWVDLLTRPESFGVPSFTDIKQLYSTRTPTRFITSRVTFEMEQQLRFLLTHVQMGEQRRYQTWFALKYLSSPESESLVCDLIRFICCVIHPTNQILQSNIMPRWAVVGWLLKCCRSAHVESNAKLSLLYDWLFFSPQTENVMNIEPAILCIFYSLPKYAELSNSLLEFLFLLLDHYDEDRQHVLTQGVKNSVDVLVGKGVVPHLHLLSESPQIPQNIRERVQRLFPAYCRVKAPVPLKTTEPKSEEKPCEGRGRRDVKPGEIGLKWEKQEADDFEEGEAEADRSLSTKAADLASKAKGSSHEHPAAGGEGSMPSSHDSSVAGPDTGVVKVEEQEGEEGTMMVEARDTLLVAPPENDVAREVGIDGSSEEEASEGDEGVETDVFLAEGSDEAEDEVLHSRGETCGLIDLDARFDLVSWGSNWESMGKLERRSKRRRLNSGGATELQWDSAVLTDHAKALQEQLRNVSAKNTRDGTEDKGNETVLSEAVVEEELLECVERFAEKVLGSPAPLQSNEGKSAAGPDAEEVAGQVEDSGPPKRRRTGDLHGVRVQADSDSKGGEAQGEDAMSAEVPVLQELADYLVKVALGLQIPLFCPQALEQRKEGISGKVEAAIRSGSEGIHCGSLLSLLIRQHMQARDKNRHRVPQILHFWQKAGLEVSAWVLCMACQQAKVLGHEKASNKVALRDKSEGDSQEGSPSRTSSDSSSQHCSPGFVHPEPDIVEVTKGDQRKSPKQRSTSREQSTLPKLFQLYLELYMLAEGRTPAVGELLGSVSTEGQGGGRSAQLFDTGDHAKQGHDKKTSPAARKRKRVKSLEALTAAAELAREDSNGEALTSKEAERGDSTPVVSPRCGLGQVLAQVVADVETCFIRSPSSPPSLLAALFRYLPQVCCTSPRLLQILVASADPVALAKLEMELSLGPLSVMGASPREAEFRKLLVESLSWDWVEQEWLWRLLAAEAVRWNETVFVALLTAIRDISGTKNLAGAHDMQGSQAASKDSQVAPESAFLLAGLKAALQVASPTRSLVLQLVSLPSQAFGMLVTATLHQWAVRDTRGVMSMLQSGELQLDDSIASSLAQSIRTAAGSSQEGGPKDALGDMENLAALVESCAES